MNAESNRIADLGIIYSKHPRKIKAAGKAESERRFILLLIQFENRADPIPQTLPVFSS
jgi:hypothetical protein